MANEEHLKWLFEGTAAWNTRRINEDFTPDFAESDLSGEDLSSVNLFRANLTKADLSGANLTNANLIQANLREADLTHADLSGSDLTSADLANADLTNADLSRSGLINGNLTNSSLAGADLSYSDLSDANLTGASLTSADLTDAVLVKAELSNATFVDALLPGANLSNSNLTGADFSNAILVAADFIDSNLSHANLSGALLVSADFTNASLANAILDNANLSDAFLTRANLSTTDLARADLSGAKIEEAILFDEPVEAVAYYPTNTLVGSIGDLLNIIRDINDNHRSEFLMYFRGEPQDGWELRPSVLRNQLSVHEGAMLRDLTARRPEEFSTASSALAQWVLARHHGLQTRFLDITRNPLVALFFACENDRENNKVDGRLHVFVVSPSLVKPYNSDAISVIANFAKLSSEDQLIILRDEQAPSEPSYRESLRRLYQSIRSEKPYFEDRISIKDFYRVFVVEPQQSSERIRAQSGAFFVSAFHERFEREEIIENVLNVPVYDHYILTIPQDKKPRIRAELRLAGIRRETLFPGLDTAAEAVTEMYTERM